MHNIDKKKYLLAIPIVLSLAGSVYLLNRNLQNINNRNRNHSNSTRTNTTISSGESLSPLQYRFGIYPVFPGFGEYPVYPLHY